MKKSTALLLTLLFGITLLSGCGGNPSGGDIPVRQAATSAPSAQATPEPEEPEPEILDMADYTITLVDGWEGRDIGGNLDLQNPKFKASDASDDKAYILIYSWSSSSASEQVSEMLEKNPEKNKQLDNLICNGVEYLRITSTAGGIKTILYTSYGKFDPDSRGYIQINVGTINDFDKFLPILETIKLK